jgi:hypothetical protein
MIEVSISRNSPESRDKVWDVIGAFDTLGWTGAIDTTKSTSGKMAGAFIRTLVTKGDNPLTFVEELEGFGPFFIDYKVVEGVSSTAFTRLSVVENKAMGGSTITWAAKFSESELTAEQADQERSGLQGFFTGALNTLVVSGLDNTK